MASSTYNQYSHTITQQVYISNHNTIHFAQNKTAVQSEVHRYNLYVEIYIDLFSLGHFVI